MQYTMFLVMRDIRGKSDAELVAAWRAWAPSRYQDRLGLAGALFAGGDRFANHREVLSQVGLGGVVRE